MGRLFLICEELKEICTIVYVTSGFVPTWNPKECSHSFQCLHDFTKQGKHCCLEAESDKGSYKPHLSKQLT